MTKSKLIILLVLMVTILSSCHKMTKREAVNFNDNVMFCVEDIEKYQSRACVFNQAEGLTIEDMEHGYDKVIEESNDYKAELKDVFKSYKHPACKKLKKAFYIYVDEQIKLTNDYKPQIIDLYKVYLTSQESGDSIAITEAYTQFADKVKKYEADSKPIIEKLFAEQDKYVAETGIKLR